MHRQAGRVCVILLNWNGKSDTLECLDSLKKASYRKLQPIVVDNGSTDGSVQAIREAHPLIPILETHQNLGFAGGNNVGIEWALRKPFEWILLLNNDTTVDPCLIEGFLKAAEEKKAKLLGAKIYLYKDPLRIDHLGGFWNPKIAEFECPLQGTLDDGTQNEAQLVDYVSGCALFMHRSVPETIGLLEPSFFLYWEETDYCFRAKKAGFEIWTAPEAKVYHKVSTSFTGGKPHMHYFWWRSRLLWISRNCTKKEKRALYQKVILLEILKTLRHYCLKSLQSKILFCLGKSNIRQKEKARRYKAGLMGVLHYFCKKFGNCPTKISTPKMIQSRLPADS